MTILQCDKCGKLHVNYLSDMCVININRLYSADKEIAFNLCIDCLKDLLSFCKIDIDFNI